MNSIPTDPVLSCESSISFEKQFFGGDEIKEWQIMTRAGQAIGDALLRDMRELRTISHRPNLLVLVGKGHNGGDALIAARRFLRTIPTARAVVFPICKWEDCRPLTQRAWKELEDLAEKRIQLIDPSKDSLDQLKQVVLNNDFNAQVDGFLGMQAKLPLRDPLPSIIQFLNQSDKISVRIAVDMPTGVTGDGTENPLRADFTYCTGIVKEPVLLSSNADSVGRIRYLDLDFFAESEHDECKLRVLRPDTLRKLRRLRQVDRDKRTHGHLFLLGGSRDLGGAVMMAAQAALKAGVGLLTVGVPESLHSSFVARLPEAMWVPLPETPDGFLALEGLGRVRHSLDKATSLAIGPGIGKGIETQSLVRETCNFFDGSTLLDADALQPEIFQKLKNKQNLVITPHSGEFDRLSGGQKSVEWIKNYSCTLVLKGSHSKIFTSELQIISLGGSSVLARGGSGDLLSGILGALLAKKTFSHLEAACLAVQWHGRAAEALARQHGQESVLTTEILNYLSTAIRNDI